MNLKKFLDAEAYLASEQETIKLHRLEDIKQAASNH
jgi:hypothetical protein